MSSNLYVVCVRVVRLCVFVCFDFDVDVSRKMRMSFRLHSARINSSEKTKRATYQRTVSRTPNSKYGWMRYLLLVVVMVVVFTVYFL